MKENGFSLKKARSRYFTKTTMNADDTDDLVLLANTQA